MNTPPNQPLKTQPSKTQPSKNQPSKTQPSKTQPSKTPPLKTPPLKPHPLNVSYLVVGLVFLGISGSWALRTSGLVDAGETRWLLPAVLVVAGVIGLVAVAAKGIGRGREEQADDEA